MSKTKRLLLDLMRIVLLLVVTGVVLYRTDQANAAVFQALGIAIFVVGGTHLTRRLLFPRIDLQDVALNAVKENNGSAALVFLAVCAVMVSVMFLSVGLLK